MLLVNYIELFNRIPDLGSGGAALAGYALGGNLGAALAAGAVSAF